MLYTINVVIDADPDFTAKKCDCLSIFINLYINSIIIRSKIDLKT